MDTDSGMVMLPDMDIHTGIIIMGTMFPVNMGIRIQPEITIKTKINRSLTKG